MLWDSLRLFLCVQKPSQLVIYRIIICYIYIAFFLSTQSALHSKGDISSSTTNVQDPPGWCDGNHIVPERPPHTSLLVERRQSDEANQCMGIIRRPWWSEASGLIWPGCGVTPYSFSKDILGFLMTTESQDLGLASHPKDSAFYSIVSPILHWGVRTHTDYRVSTPCWSH